MSEKIKVLVTDYAWSTLKPERNILNQIGADLIVAAGMARCLVSAF